MQARPGVTEVGSVLVVPLKHLLCQGFIGAVAAAAGGCPVCVSGVAVALL